MPVTNQKIDWNTIVSSEPRVRLIAHGLTSDPDEAKEVVQETLLRLTSSLQRYRRGNFDGWLYRVTRNVFLDLCRARKRRDQILSRVVTQQRSERTHTVADASETAELRAAVREAILRLPDALRHTIVLREFRGLSYDQIGRALGIPNNTVRSRIHRARERLRAMLSDYLPRT